MTEEKSDGYKMKLPFLRKRCPNLNEEELREAEENFCDYIMFVLEIYEEREREGKPLVTEEEWKEVKKQEEELRREFESS